MADVSCPHAGDLDSRPRLAGRLRPIAVRLSIQEVMPTRFDGQPAPTSVSQCTPRRPPTHSTARATTIPDMCCNGSGPQAAMSRDWFDLPLEENATTGRDPATHLACATRSAQRLPTSALNWRLGALTPIPMGLDEIPVPVGARLRDASLS
jgi:hypothetical protein